LARGPVDLPERLGTLGNSGPMVTRGGLVFLGGGDPFLYAFDKATGMELWRGATLFPTNENLMTYQTRSGRQFVVIATGGGSDSALVAFAGFSALSGSSLAAALTMGRVSLTVCGSSPTRPGNGADVVV